MAFYDRVQYPVLQAVCVCGTFHRKIVASKPDFKMMAAYPVRIRKPDAVRTDRCRISKTDHLLADLPVFRAERVPFTRTRVRFQHLVDKHPGSSLFRGLKGGLL